MEFIAFDSHERYTLASVEDAITVSDAAVNQGPARARKLYGGRARKEAGHG